MSTFSPNSISILISTAGPLQTELEEAKAALVTERHDMFVRLYQSAK